MLKKQKYTTWSSQGIDLYFHPSLYLPSQRELELQRRLSEASDREYANRQENLRLERLAEQLHVQNREFDLGNFGGDMSDDKMAELRER